MREELMEAAAAARAPWTSPRQATDAEDAAEVEAEDEGPRNKLLPNEEEERSGLIHDQNLKDKLAV